MKKNVDKPQSITSDVEVIGKVRESAAIERLEENLKVLSEQMVNLMKFVAQPSSAPQAAPPSNKEAVQILSLDQTIEILLSRLNKEFPNYTLFKIGGPLFNGELDQAALGIKGLVWGNKRVVVNTNIQPNKDAFMQNIRQEDRVLGQPFIVDIFIATDPTIIHMDIEDQFTRYRREISTRINFYRERSIPYITHYRVDELEKEIRMIRA